jgi:hypothetical protein
LKQTLFLTSKTIGFDTFQYNLFNDLIKKYCLFYQEVFVLQEMSNDIKFYFDRFQNQPVLPLIPKGNWLIFQLSPFWVWGRKAEKSLKNLIMN